MLSFIFNVHEVARTTNHSCFFNVFENPHPVRKKRYLTRDDTPIAHMMNDGSKASEKLLMIDHVEVGDYLFEASFKLFNYAGKNHYLRSGNNFAWHHTNVIVTGVFDQENSPLWYGHRLNLLATEIELISDNSILSKDKYKIVEEVDYESTSTYLTICHSIDIADKLYFVKYKLNDQIYLELLNQERLFHRSFEFITDFYSPANKKMLVYKVVKELNKLRIVLPEETESIAIKEKEYSVYSSIPPYQFGNEPWHLETPLVEFFSGQHFDLWEYDNQYFDYGRPFKLITHDVGIVQSKHLIRISHQEIQNTNIEVLLYEEDSSMPDLLLTNNESLIGKVDLTFQKEWERSRLSVNALNNMIYIPQDISRYSFAKVTYKIRSYSYIDERINLNPYLNPAIIDKKIVHYLHPTKGLLYFVLDSQNFITEVSHDDYSTWVDKQYDIPALNVNNTLSFFFWTGSLLKDSLDNDDAILLATIHEPSNLEEYDSSIKSVRKLNLPTLEQAYYEMPSLLPLVDNEIHENIWSIPELKNSHVIHVHWTKLKDYVTTELITKKALYEYLNKRTSASHQVLIIEDGIPVIETSTIDLENDRFLVEWIPPLQLAEPIEATFYKSTNGVDFTALTVVNNMIYQRSLWFNLDSDYVYIKARPRITRNGDTYFGRYSNTICVSRKVI